MNEIKYSSAKNIINGTSQTPISNSETAVINVFGPLASATNNPDNQYDFLSGNTQASLGFNYTHGSLTNIKFRIYWYRYEVNANANPYQKTAGTITSGNEVLSLHTLEIDTADGRYNYDFQIPACDGIKVTVQSSGTTTNSSLTEIHLALRTN